MSPIENLVRELRKFHTDHLDIAAAEFCDLCVAVHTVVNSYMGLLECLKESAEMAEIRVMVPESMVNTWKTAITRAEKND